MAVVAFVGLLEAAGGADGRRQDTLRREGQPTTGAVTALETRQRRAVRYAFVVDGREYAGIGQPGLGSPRFEDLAVGDEVLVYYWPPDPSVSRLGAPRSPTSDWLIGAIVVLGVPALVVLGNARRILAWRLGTTSFG